MLWEQHRVTQTTMQQVAPYNSSVQVDLYIDMYLNQYKLSTEDRQDLAQIVRIKYDKAQQKGVINHPAAFIGRVVRNVCIDHYRQHRHDEQWLSLESLEEGGHSLADSFTTESNNMDDHLSYQDTLNWLVEKALTLSPAKREAMLRHLKEVVVNTIGDAPYLTRLFAQHGLDINQIQIPLEEKAQKADYMSRRMALAQIRPLLRKLKDTGEL
jgi:hypothetical protein